MKTHNLRFRVLQLFCLGLLVFACKSKTKETSTMIEAVQQEKTSVTKEENPGSELLEKCLQAHGGLAAWKSFEGLEYTLDDNGKMVYQLTHLRDRRAYLKSKKYEVGFDGEVAWALPDAKEVSGKSAAFYYNLDFYFIGIPFLLKDPGVHTSYEGKAVVGEKEYESLKVTFGSEVGYTPEDVYYLYLDPETYVLRILTYSISYFDRENAGINSAKVYSDYKNVQGLLMPHKMENFEWNKGVIGKSKNHLRRFSDIAFLKDIPNKQLFNVPLGAITETLNEQ